MGLDLELTQKDLDALQSLRNLIQVSEDEILLNAYESFTDEYLIRFIRSRGYDEEQALDRIQKVQELRVNKYPDMFATLIPTLLQKVFHTKAIEILKKRDLFGRSIIVLSAKLWDPKVFTAEEGFQGITMAAWECHRSKETQEHGVVLLFNTADVTLNQLKNFNPNFLMRWANIAVKASPVKLKGLHFINMHRILHMTLSIFKMFSPEKISNRIYTYGKPTPGMLNEFIAPENLPKSFGGYLAEEEAMDAQFVSNIFSENTENYYRTFSSCSLAALKVSNQ